MRILGQGTVNLLCKCPNRKSPFILQLENVYFIPECTVNLVSTFQLSLHAIAFDSEIPCLKAFGTTDILCAVTPIHRHYALDAIPKFKSEFMEFTGHDNYLILDPLEHQLLIWHRRLGHASLGKIRQAIEKTQGIDLSIPPSIRKLPFCEACALGKSQKKTSRIPQQRADKPGQKLHVDLAGPITPVGIGKVRWFLTVVDDYCRWRRVKSFKEKGDTEEVFHGMINWAETQWGVKVQALRIDGGREFGVTSLESFASKRGIIVEPSTPHNPHQNRIAKRSIRLICTMARTMILDLGLLLYLWPEAIITAAEILNRLPTKALSGAIPFTLQDKEKRLP
jgi:hypothetical protein